MSQPHVERQGNDDYKRLHAFLEKDEHDRFYDLKRGAMDRMGRSDMTNDEFVSLLLDVYEMHLGDDQT